MNPRLYFVSPLDGPFPESRNEVLVTHSPWRPSTPLGTPHALQGSSPSGRPQKGGTLVLLINPLETSHTPVH